MKNKTTRKLALNKETVRQLNAEDLRRANGQGKGTYATCVCTDTCLTNCGGAACDAYTVIQITVSLGGMC